MVIILNINKKNNFDTHNLLIAADYKSEVSGNFIGSLIDLLESLISTGRKVFFSFPSNADSTKQPLWINWLKQKGGKVYLLDIDQSDEERISFLRKIIIKNDIEILHLHFGIFNSLVLHHRNAFPCKVIWHEHMSYPMGCNRLKQTLRYMLRSLWFRKNRIAFVSVSKRMYNAHIFCKRFYIPNGLSMKRNINESMSREALRKQLCISDDEKIVLLLGWAYKLKGLDIAVQAISECRESGQNVVLGTIGVDLTDEDVSRFVKEKTGLSTSESWIKSLPGGEDMFAYHRAIDVYLSASRAEAFSYGILETISQNTPLVVSDIVETKWCQEYSKAFVYSVEDPSKCAEAINKALSIGRNKSNYKDICEKYSIIHWCEQVVQVYESV